MSRTDEKMGICPDMATEDDIAEEVTTTVHRRLHRQPILTINKTVNESELDVAVREPPCKRKLLNSCKLHTAD